MQLLLHSKRGINSIGWLVNCATGARGLKIGNIINKKKSRVF